ncbi:MAG: alpha/beta hydrolase [Bacteroidia bacterium]|nr:alpha/beta hydrolase [Bacteroidia bacterium]
MKEKFIIVLVVTMFITSVESSFALNPSRTYKVKPEKYGMQYKEEKIKTKDDMILNTWFFETTKKTTNWLVISHSGDGNMADNIELCGQFLSAGLNVVMYDYRGYGESSEFTIDPDIFIYPQFITDLNTVLDYLRKSRAITKFDLFGIGIGGGLSLGVGANRPETKKIVADGPWTGLEIMKKKYKEKKDKDIIIPFGFDKNFEPIYAMDKPRNSIRGVMIIVSPQDELITPNDTKMIKSVTETYIVKSSPSNAENFSTDKNAYFDKVSKFLNN